MNGSPGGRMRLLLVEDDPGDVVLARESLGSLLVTLDLDVVEDGTEALAFLRREGNYRHARRPDLILLDLNLPRKDGWEVLGSIKSDALLKAIPVVVLTTSKSDGDIRRAYELGANCFITKPPGLSEYESAIRRLGDFWLSVARIPESTVPHMNKDPAAGADHRSTP
ncbi:MAG TPA: response regulator [Kiritimatiellia bacterium]